MFKHTVALMVFLGVFVFTLHAQNTHTAEEYQICYRLFEIMEMDKTMRDTTNKLVDVQLNAFSISNADKAKVRPVLIKFFEKYMSYDSLKRDLAEVYLKYFTIKDIQELIKFYQTPTGRKFIKNQSVLMSEGADLGVKRVQSHQDELQLMLMQAMKE